MLYMSHQVLPFEFQGGAAAPHKNNSIHEGLKCYQKYQHAIPNLIIMCHSRDVGDSARNVAINYGEAPVILPRAPPCLS